jgi:hypothetical protein
MVPGTAFGQKKKVVLYSFFGPRAVTYRDQVMQIIRRHVRLIGARRYRRVARRNNAKRLSAKNVKKNLTELEAHGFIVGAVKRRGRRYVIRIRVRNQATGGTVTLFNIGTRSKRIRGAARRVLRKKLLRAIRRLPELDIQEPPPKEGDDDDDGGEGDDDGGKKVADKGGDDDGGKVEKKAEPGPPLTDAEKADLAIRGRGMEVNLGVSGVSRKLTFTFNDTLAYAPRGYSGNLVGGAYISGELYPLAFDLKNRGKSRNIGIIAVYDRVLKIDSRMRYTSTMTNMQAEAVLPTSQERWGIGLVYRHNFGNKPTSPTVKISARYNRFKFNIDKTQAPDDAPDLPPINEKIDIPNVDYTYVDPGIAIRYPMGPKLALHVEGRFLFVTSTGDMEDVMQYGSATVTGYDVDAGFEWRIDKRLSLRVGGRILGVAFDFDGTGTLVNNRDEPPDPNSVDVGGALDRYLGGYATIGYLF